MGGAMVKLHLGIPTAAEPSGKLHSGRLPFSRANEEKGIRDEVALTPKGHRLL